LIESSMQPIDRVALDFGVIQIYWYGLIIASGAFLGFLLANRESKKRGLPKDTFVDLVMIAVPVSILTARLYYVIFEWQKYKDSIADVFAIWNGGIAIHGALIGAFLTAYIFTKRRELSFWTIADIAAPSIILGQAIGRWGNFINQEAHGGPVSRSFLENLWLPDFIINQMYIDGVYYQPTFLYESVWNMIGFFVLITLKKFNLKNGEVFLSYIIWYSIGRFAIEGMRTDSLMLTSSLKMAQIISIVLIVLSFFLIVYRRTKKNSRVS